jgi:signal transduction histidine kinase
MSEITGIDFLKELRAQGNDIPFIIFTGVGKEGVAIEALNFGAYMYFNKNGNPDVIYTELAHSLRKAVNARMAEDKIRSLAKFPSEDPNPVLRITKDGSLLYVNKAARKHKCKTNQGIPKILHQTVVNSLNSGSTEEVDIDCDGQLFSFVVAPILEEGYANVYGRNISESKAAWISLEETINALTMINEKLGMVSKVTRHDGRNKLSVILNNAYLAKQRLNGNHDALQYIENIESSVDQMRKIFEFARNYEMLGIEELTDLNVKQSFNEAVMLLLGIKNISVINRCTGLIVQADSLLRQLFYNLIHNSLTHGETVTEIKLRYKKKKDNLNLIYEDNGVGVPEDEKEKIFVEGYGKGTGYGLYLIRKICEVYGWTIHETGVPKKGAQFVMVIPKTNKEGKLSFYFTKK